MVILQKGQYRARFAQTPNDIMAAQRLRATAFLGDHSGLDQDEYDDQCLHVLIEDVQSGQLRCCFRMMFLAAQDCPDQTYSAQFYDLKHFKNFDGAKLELGRFCIAPDVIDPDILRLAWTVITQFVDERDVKILFGCSSFHGTDAAAYTDALALLKERHLGPKKWMPRIKAPKIYRFAKELKGRKPDIRAAQRTLPPLLRSYLTLGGWVSDHAVVDRALGTLHVFTGVEIASISPARKRVLRGAI
ncbi:ornithine-acyl-ACP acyltransferase [Amylibacter kogurei]|uniref:L-ornithine N(alpha)-acyltransferase n=1 Tax=Paramylibacter kogurei TaxID=1889778 RepID=A0A2G5K442_9RHOB|nr:GNAT family N-acyltransferase [Amylibacter kogurei]PIB24306.1 ornithine-acyl-ACP acyltransferase [Amylibacter kogurei]